MVNVGDEDYAPLFPFGWGLSTGGGRTSTLDNHRLDLQNVTLNPTNGVPPQAAKAIAKSDVAELEGKKAQALRLLTEAREN